MPRVWLCIPSARPISEAEPILALWRDRGYGIALWRDTQESPPCDILIVRTYSGYAKAVNALVAAALSDHDAEWFVCAGDDTEPDLTHSPNLIADTCNQYFGAVPRLGTISRKQYETFGVMQSTGDRWGDSPQSRAQYGENRGAFIDRICGSPWMGRTFCERINGGIGPLWPEYTHMFADEEMQEVCQKLGILWQRRDLVHLHHHFTRDGDLVNWEEGRKRIPTFLREANSPAHWEKFRHLFRQRKALGFPGHEPLPIGEVV